LNGILRKKKLDIENWRLSVLQVASIFFNIKPCNTFPGPISVNTVAPSFTNLLYTCVHLTALVIAALSFFLISAGLFTAVVGTFEDGTTWALQIGIIYCRLQVFSCRLIKASGMLHQLVTFKALLAPAVFNFSHC